MPRSNPLKITESKVQKAFFQHVNILKYQRPEYEYIVATPNAGGPDMYVWGNIRKAEGASKDFPDISVLLPRAGYHSLYIELKLPGKKPRPGQAEWLNRLNAAGHLAIWIATDDWSVLAKVVDDYLYSSIDNLITNLTTKKTAVKDSSTAVKAKT